MIDYSFSYADFEYFLLVFARMSAFVVSAPFFSMQNVPRRFKAGFAFFVSVVIYEAVVPHQTVEYLSIISFSIIVIKECIVGILIGYGANICLSAINLAGKIADIEVGLSMIQVLDPLTRDMSGFTGNIYTYGVTLILIVTDMHHYVLKAFIESYRLIPISHVNIQTDSIVDSSVKFLAGYVSIAFRFCFPVLAAIMILNAVLGMLAKVAPQMNMFAVGIQFKLIVGLSTIFLTITLIPNLSEMVFKQMREMMTLMTESLMP